MASSGMINSSRSEISQLRIAVHSILRLQWWWRQVLLDKSRLMSIILLQSFVRGFIARIVANRKKNSILLIQRWWRKLLFIKLRIRSVLVIQTHFRGWIARRVARRDQQFIVTIQRLWRKLLYIKLRARSVVIIQAHFRGWIARRAVRQDKHLVILIQAHVRGWIARREARRDKHRIVTIQPNSIILAISPANQDIATSDAIKLAREVDPSGERTFGVLTKLDLMDKGTNALDVLEGRAYRLQHPWVGVVNRSQADINKSVDMMAARRREREYFATSPDYSHLSHKMGSEYLAKLLSKHLESVIRARIPSITSLINKSIDELESEMNHIGRPIAVDAGAQLYTILELCRAFDKIFKEHLDGGRPGGDRIYGVFDNQLPAALKKLPFDTHLSQQNVRKIISEADGYQPHLIAPEQGYRRLIERSLNYFRGPAEASVDAVHFVLKELVRKSIGETQELKRFPTLQSELAAASYEALEKFREDSRKTAVRLVDMESSYLTVDFFRKLPQEVEKAGAPAAANVDRYTDGHFRKIASNVSSYIGMVSDTLKHTIPKAVVYCQVREAKRSLLNHFYTLVGRKEGKQLAQLLDEDPALMERRQQCAKRLELYKSARDEIDSVSWAR